MKKTRQRILSMAAAAAIGCSVAVSSGVSGVTAFAEEKTTAEDRLVPVMVKVSGEGLLAGADGAQQGTDFLDTADAAAKASSLLQMSRAAESYIRSLYPALEIGYRYDVLLNGFSCELPESLIDRVRECQWVESVSETRTMNVVKPELYYAPEAGGVDFFGETTGYFGEGEVIAVLDCEFDVTHSMFAPIDDKENKLTKEDIAAVAGSLNVNVDPDRAYVSSKLPFVFDYGDDTPYDVAFEEEYHGTHVAGIAAGDLIKDNGGEEIAGIARDAQLVMMKVFSDVVVDDECDITEYSVDEDVLLAAFEDAAKLKVDVINLSFGGPEPDLNSLPYCDALKALNNAGVMVVAAAGNSANNRITSGDWLDMDASVPDTQTLGEPAAFSDVFCVASAENTFSREQCFLIEGLDDEIPFLDTGVHTVFDMLGDGVHEYVYCGLGLESDFEGKDVEGKAVLLDRGEITFSEKAINATDAGASCMIVCNNAEADRLVSMIIEGTDLPAAFISMNDGEKLKKAESGKLRIDSTHVLVTPLNGGISSFSSYGPTEDLRIKPEIAGIGGAVTSSAYKNGLKVMDGTSMASPYVAGCAAVFDQYLRKNGTELTGAEKTAFIKNIFMNSADLFVNDGLYESPRRQGAGLIDLRNVLNDRVMLTGKDGLAKIELKDNLTDKFSFDVNIRNFSDQDVEFTDAKLVLTTDEGGQLTNDESGQITICGGTPFGCTADLSSLLRTAAGESRTETVSVELSQSSMERTGRLFPNGFFVEGYIVLSGAENCCDISIPVMGFCGDWTQVPIFHEGTKYLDSYSIYTTEGTQAIENCMSVSAYCEAIYELMERLPEEERLGLMNDPELLVDYMDEQFLARVMEITDDNAYISPDGDGMADHLGINLTVLRSCHVSGLKIYNSSGEVVNTADEGLWLPAHGEVNSVADEDLSALPEGKYTGVIEGYVSYEGADAKPQKYSFPIIVDKTAPVLDIAGKEKDGKKLIEITSSDSNLDGIYIMGKGTGGIYGEYSGERMEIYGTVTGIGSLYTEGGLFNEKVVPESLLISALTGEGDAYSRTLLDSFDFTDIIPADKYMGDDGNMKITYDVTGFEDYAVIAMDKAFNTTEKRADTGVTARTLVKGAWWAHRGGDGDAYYNFWDDKEGNVRYQNGADEESFTFEQTDDKLIMNITGDNGTVTRTGSISFTEGGKAVITWEDGKEEVWTYENADGFAGFFFRTTDEMKEMVLEYHNKNSDNKAASAEVSYNENDLCTVALFDESGSRIAEYTDFDRFGDTAKDPDGNDVTFQYYFKKGVYRVIYQPVNDSNHYSALFTEDDKVLVASAEDGLLYEYEVTYDEETMTVNMDTDDELTVTYYIDMPGVIDVRFPDGRSYELALEPSIPAKNYKAYSTAELERLAGDYAERIRADRPKIISAEFDDYGAYVIQFSDGQGITVDPIDGTGVDQGGDGVILTELPEIKDLFSPGIWTFNTGDMTKYYCIENPGTIRVIDPADGAEHIMEYEWTGVKAVDITEDGKTERVLAAPASADELALVYSDNSAYMLRKISDDPADMDNFYSAEQLGEWAAKNYWYKTGVEAAVSETISDPEGNVTIVLDNGAEYTVNHFTGKGTDADGKETDLPQTGNNDTSTASAAAAAGVMMLLGAAAVYASAVLRRKEE